MEKYLFRIAFLPAPPIALSFLFLPAIKITQPLGVLISSSSTTPLAAGVALDEIVNKIDEAGLKSAFIKYDTTVESRYGGFIGSQPIISGYVFCDNAGEKQTFLYGEKNKKVISENSSIGDTKSALGNFFCDKAPSIGPEVFKLEPGQKFTMETSLLIQLTPTDLSCIKMFLLVLSVWIGILILIREGLIFIKKGFKNYFLSSRT